MEEKDFDEEQDVDVKVPDKPSDAVAHAHKSREEQEYYLEEVSQDHRVLQLQKMRHKFIDESGPTLTKSSLEMEDQGPSLIICPNCKSEEVRGHRFCSKCNAKLPQLALSDQKYNPGSIDGAARKYYDAVNDFHSENISLDDFIDFLSKGLEKVRSHSENMAELSSDGVIAEWLPEASALINNANQLWHDSVENMLVRIDEVQAEFEEEEEELDSLSQEELAQRKPLVSLEERVQLLDFTPELDSIFRANDMMLEYLSILDASVKNETTIGGMQF